MTRPERAIANFRELVDWVRGLPASGSRAVRRAALRASKRREPIRKVLLFKLCRDEGRITEARRRLGADVEYAVFEPDAYFDSGPPNAEPSPLVPRDVICPGHNMSVFRELLEWRNRLPSLRLEDGTVVGEVAVDGFTLVRGADALLALELFAILRIVVAVDDVFRREAPDAWVLVEGEHPFPWLPSLIEQVAALHGSHLTRLCADSPPRDSSTSTESGALVCLLEAWGFEEVCFNGDPGTEPTIDGGFLRLDTPIPSSCSIETVHPFRSGESCRLRVVMNVLNTPRGRVEIEFSNGRHAVTLAMTQNSIGFATVPERTVRLAAGFHTIDIELRSGAARVVIDGCEALRTVEPIPSTQSRIRWGHDCREASPKPKRLRSHWRLMDVRALPPDCPTPKMPHTPAAARFAEARAGPHSLLVLRGMGGLRWRYSDARSEWRLYDEYCEGILEALVLHAEREGGRVSIVYGGSMPDYSDERPSYESRHPGILREYELGEFNPTHSQAGNSAAISENVENLFADPAFRESFRFHGVDLLAFKEAKIAGALLSGARGSAITVQRWRNVIHRLRPDVIWGSNLSAAICHACHATGVPSISSRRYFGYEMLVGATPAGQVEAGTHYAPHLQLYWGSRQVELVRAHGLGSPDSSAATGRPRSDVFVQERGTVSRQRVCAILGVPANERIILFGATHRTKLAAEPGSYHGACCMSRRSFAWALAALDEAARRIEHTRVLLKPHPSDDYQALLELVAPFRERVILAPAEIPLHNLELLSVAGVFVSSQTTMFTEALLLDVPTVCLDVPEVEFLYDEIRSRELYPAISEYVRDSGALVDTVVDLVLDPEVRQRSLDRCQAGLEPWIGPSDGRRAESMVDTGFHWLEARGVGDA